LLTGLILAILAILPAKNPINQPRGYFKVFYGYTLAGLIGIKVLKWDKF